MNDNLKDQIEINLGARITKTSGLGGGSAASVVKAGLSDGREVVIKYGTGASDVYLKEGNGLRELTRSGTIYVPEVLATHEQFLVTEYLKPSPQRPDAMLKFGINFAKMHRFTQSYFGFYEDNYLGDALQKNGVQEKLTNWDDFYLHFRLDFQIDWGKRHGRFSEPFLAQYSKFRAICKRLLAESDQMPRLLHGDLWSGNYIVNQYGEISIIDPAVYYGHREADLAMTKVFGGFSPDFYKGYQQEFPLDQGWEEREDIYKLYHILNHYNLFGGGYLMQAEHIINHYIK